MSELKVSEVLKKALAEMDGGNKWHKGEFYEGDKCCSLGAIRRFSSADSNLYWQARELLSSAIDNPRPAEWNDKAADFSVIEQGFQKAILLAESEGQ